jgi:hypothetical protein
MPSFRTYGPLQLYAFLVWCLDTGATMSLSLTPFCMKYVYNKFILVETKSIYLSVVVGLKRDVEMGHNEDLIIGTPFCINIVQVAVVVK